jgi:hypothetical protein
MVGGGRVAEPVPESCLSALSLPSCVLDVHLHVPQQLLQTYCHCSGFYKIRPPPTQQSSGLGSYLGQLRLHIQMEFGLHAVWHLETRAQASGIHLAWSLQR